MTKRKQLEQELKVEKAREKLEQDEKKLKAMNKEKKQTNTKKPKDDIPEYKNSWIAGTHELFKMINNNVEPIAIVIVLAFMIYILFK